MQLHRAITRSATSLLASIALVATMGFTVEAAPAQQRATPAPDNATALRGDGMTVWVDKAFPRVIRYDVGSRSMDGQPAPLTQFRINGVDYAAQTTATFTDGANYTSTFRDFPDVTVNSRISLREGNVDFRITGIDGAAARSVNQISIPNHSLISVDSSDSGSALARTKNSPDSNTTADQFIPVTPEVAADPAPVGTPYGMVNNSALSASIVSNSTEDSPQYSRTNANTRLMTQIIEDGENKRAGLSSGDWVFWPKGSSEPYELPSATVVIAADINRDGKQDWQDAAIKVRRELDAQARKLGPNRVPERVVSHIPFNFASQATNPFLKSADNMKRIHASTDGLGQWLLHKGYTNEGHDSANTDYGGNYNERAGGARELNELIRQADGLNSDVAVHVNATEAYPQANSFSDRLIAGQRLGWSWLNQSYYIDQRWDLNSGNVKERFAQLKREVPGLNSVYIDVYYSSGWLADSLSKFLRRDLGLEVSTEWSDKLEGHSFWSHWANDRDYGGTENKGLNSNITRFITNSTRDTWNDDVLLGGSRIEDFEGWTGENDWNRFYEAIWTTNLPTKFIQHYDVERWEPGKRADLRVPNPKGRAGERISVTAADGKRTITMDGVTVLDGGKYLLPWGPQIKQESATTSGPSSVSSPAQANKMYYYNADGGAATFKLTRQFAGVAEFNLLRLTDQGRVNSGTVVANNGSVTLPGEAGTPFVLEPVQNELPAAEPTYGESGPFVDPGFNAGNLSAWNSWGGAQIQRNSLGDNVLRLGAGNSGMYQQPSGLQPGRTYNLSADIEIAPTGRRDVTLAVGRGAASPTNPDWKPLSAKAINISPLPNTLAASSKSGDRHNLAPTKTHSQRVNVCFTAPAGEDWGVTVRAKAGEPAVTVDDLHIIADDCVPDRANGTPGYVIAANGNRVLVNEDFEGNRPGWSPFFKGDAGGTTDPRTSISHRNEPFTQKPWKNANAPYNSGSLLGQATDDVISGQRSLKSHEENTGLVYRTLPQSVRFEPGKTYRVEFKYQTNVENQWEWVEGYDTIRDGKVATIETSTSVFQPSLDTKSYSKTFTVPAGGDGWVGLRKKSDADGTDFTIDDFKVTRLGR